MPDKARRKAMLKIARSPFERRRRINTLPPAERERALRRLRDEAVIRKIVRSMTDDDEQTKENNDRRAKQMSGKKISKERALQYRELIKLMKQQEKRGGEK